MSAALEEYKKEKTVETIKALRSFADSLENGTVKLVGLPGVEYHRLDCTVGDVDFKLPSGEITYKFTVDKGYSVVEQLERVLELARASEKLREKRKESS